MTENEYDLDIVYRRLFQTLNELLEDNDPMVIAACMMAQALSLYRTSLSQDEYNRIVDKISDSRDSVLIFDIVSKGLMH